MQDSQTENPQFSLEIADGLQNAEGQEGSVGDLIIDEAIAQAVEEARTLKGVSQKEALEVEAAKSRALADGASLAGLGVDIVEIERIKEVMERTPRFKAKVFTEGEQAYCESKSQPYIHYALRFAAREAVLKALGTGFSGMGLRDVEVVNDPRTGQPRPILRGHAAEVAAAKGIVEVHLSLSYTHTVGVASAVAITEEAKPQRDEKPDPYEELSRQFRELRSMIDEIDEKIKEVELAVAPAAHKNGTEPIAYEQNHEL